MDFDIDHDHEITMRDFNGVEKLHFDIHHEYQAMNYWCLYFYYFYLLYINLGHIYYTNDKK
jgi:hypothetical protein